MSFETIITINTYCSATVLIFVLQDVNDISSIRKAAICYIKRDNTCLRDFTNQIKYKRKSAWLLEVAS